MKRGVVASPFRFAATLGGGYIVLTSAYITFSGRLARAVATSLDDLERIEKIKGTVFIAVSGLLLFVVTYLLARRLKRETEKKMQIREALLLSEGRALAGVMAAAVAHDCNNTLSAIGIRLELLQEKASTDKAVAGDLARVQESVSRLSEMSKRLRSLSYGNSSGSELRALKPLIEQSLDLVTRHPSVRPHDVKLRLDDSDSPLKGWVSPTSFHQIISNLLINAAEAIGPDRAGQIEVRAFNTSDSAILEVHDDGPGIPASERARLFEPFYTTKKTGTGLGLPSVLAAVQSMNGKIEILKSPLNGACFRVSLGLKDHKTA